MPSWPAEMKYISGDTRRVDAGPKVTGSARYASDIQANGWLYGMILRSKWPAAKILSVDLDKALGIPGIKAAVVVRDAPFNVRFYGDEIAAVAGMTKEACLDALRAIVVKAEPAFSFVVHEDDALKDNSPQVWEGSSNAAKPRARENGSVDTAFPECAAVIEGFYTTPVQIHNPMETHGNTVSWTDEGLTAWASTQGISSVQDGLAGALGLDRSQVRVLTEYMGGGFGSKTVAAFSRLMLVLRGPTITERFLRLIAPAPARRVMAQNNHECCIAALRCIKRALRGGDGCQDPQKGSRIGAKRPLERRD